MHLNFWHEGDLEGIQIFSTFPFGLGGNFDRFWNYLKWMPSKLCYIWYYLLQVFGWCFFHLMLFLGIALYVCMIWVLRYHDNVKFSCHETSVTCGKNGKTDIGNWQKIFQRSSSICHLSHLRFSLFVSLACVYLCNYL